MTELLMREISASTGVPMDMLFGSSVGNDASEDYKTVYNPMNTFIDYTVSKLKKVARSYMRTNCKRKYSGKFIKKS